MFLPVFKVSILVYKATPHEYIFIRFSFSTSDFKVFNILPVVLNTNPIIDIFTNYEVIFVTGTL